ncbi:Phospholipid-transporting ATPase [Caligus rogercresseyi]|uniref:Phospholipid-transporting ATPase n=1 Tax=Caligus rogercresseyi TaxID=217165 RepID=A0A7T8KIV4_CALRO|nr:Phospholipid-transporting ATPase [Caligus rogercresseyi]
MSVIVQCEETSKIFVLCKGAETSMAENISMNYSEIAQALTDEFAEEGLRTLVLGYRTISESEYKTFHDKSEEARSAVIEINRNKYMREAYSLIENNLLYAGITGIEDKLQEELPETLEAIRDAGIMIWMLTGDKRETALNIGHHTIELCNITSEGDMRMLIHSAYEKQISHTLDRRQSYNTVLVIDGKLLSFIYKNEDSKINLRIFWQHCYWDGGNDISMIQEAHVGFGIIGQEGKGASRAADFAFSKFKFLRRTLLIHGFWFYDRVAYMVQYSFYKNVVCFFCQFLIAFYSNFSATSLYNSTFIMCFNTFYTSVPVLAFGLFEKRESEETLWNNPGIYQRNVGNKQLKAVKLISWFFLGVWQAFVIFYGWLLAWQIWISSE